MTALAIETTVWSEKQLIVKECCCCLKDDCSKDIYTEYYDSGVKEVYSEMILETFNLNIKIKESNIISKQNICNSCIKQLKVAYSLKNNIINNYEAMMERINKNQSKQEIKCENFHHDYYEDTEVFYDDSKKTDIKMKQKPDLTRKRIKLKENKKNGIDTEKTSKITKIKYKIVPKSTILRKNSLKLISNSSLWVFNWTEGRYRCFCCKEPFSDIKLLKTHTETHKIGEIETKIRNTENNLVKVEVSELFCKICSKNFKNLQSLIDHLKIHNIIITGHLLVPIKINDFSCQICYEKYTNFHFLYRHMIKHYLTVICEKCGAGFYQKRHLKQHIRKNHNPDRNIKTKRKELKCNYCSERFKQFHKRILHMIEKHDLEKPEYSCDLCNKNFLTKGILNAHIKNSHNIKDRVFECDICLKRFNIKNSLVRHKDTHSDGINYTCSICTHGFKLVTSLRRHIKQKHKS